MRRYEMMVPGLLRLFVARQLDMASANLVVNSDYGGTDVPGPDGVRPNSRFVRIGK